MEVKNQSVLRIVFLICACLSLVFLTSAVASQFVNEMKGSFATSLLWGSVLGLLAFRSARQLYRNRQETEQAQRDLALNRKPLEVRPRSFKLYKPTTGHYLTEVIGSFIFMVILGSICLNVKNASVYLIPIFVMLFIVTLNFILSLLGMGIGSLRKQ